MSLEKRRRLMDSPLCRLIEWGEHGLSNRIFLYGGHFWGFFRNLTRKLQNSYSHYKNLIKSDIIKLVKPKLILANKFLLATIITKIFDVGSTNIINYVDYWYAMYNYVKNTDKASFHALSKSRLKH